jgi:hypothetical protein
VKRSWFERLVDDQPPEPAQLRAKRLGRPVQEHEYGVTLYAAGHEFNMRAPGEDPYDAALNFQKWLDDGDDPTDEIGDAIDDWRILDGRFKGQDVVFMFRSSWVAGFTVTVKQR